MSGPVLSCRDIRKSYGHVQSLQGASLDVHPAEVVALIGDNGAGKSTLVKVLSGAVQPDSGQILVDGEQVELGSPAAAQLLGIETVYQDLALAPDLDPVMNLYLGRELPRSGIAGRLGFLDRATMRKEALRAFQTLGVGVPELSAPVASFSGGQRQGVAVARAVMWAQRVVFMDEPTAALGVAQTRKVLDLVRRVRDVGRSVVLISHNMPDVLAVADRVEVLRLGRRVASFVRADVTSEDLVRAMTGSLEQEGAA
jgi:simple sugar transport system ATP-binding protein